MTRGARRRRHPRASWFFLCGDDNFVVPDNLLALLQPNFHHLGNLRRMPHLLARAGRLLRFEPLLHDAHRGLDARLQALRKGGDRNQLRKLEGNLRRKEELSNELHLIDFEQLKIENQTLNEKIEER